jgi:hypothetical protein
VDPLFNDAVHNLRAALDNLAWGLATAQGAAPTHPKRVQFPIVESTTDWANEARRTAELPIEAQHAIEAIQPFQRTGQNGTPQQDPLLLLHRLSNTEKHRLAFQPLLNPLTLGHSFAVEFRSDEEAAGEAPPQVEINADIFTSGTRILHQTTKSPIVTVKGTYEFKAQVVVTDEVHGPLGVTKTLADLLTYVPQAIEYVLGQYVAGDA